MNRCMMELMRLESWQGATVGVLSIDGEVTCFTLEPPNAMNMKNFSCIPTGDYLCERRPASANLVGEVGETWEVIRVPGRSNILIHIGNTGRDTEGCILLGMSPGYLRNHQRAILSSRDAFGIMMLKTEGYDEAILRITER